MTFNCSRLPLIAHLLLAAGVLAAPTANAACLKDLGYPIPIKKSPDVGAGTSGTLPSGLCKVQVFGCLGKYCRIATPKGDGFIDARHLAQGGGSATNKMRFNHPTWNGVRIDARRTFSAGYNMPAVADWFCRTKGFSGMADYRVQTASRTIAHGDGFIFKNGPNTNTTYRWIVCK